MARERIGAEARPVIAGRAFPRRLERVGEGTGQDLAYGGESVLGMMTGHALGEVTDPALPTTGSPGR